MCGWQNMHNIDLCIYILDQLKAQNSLILKEGIYGVQKVTEVVTEAVTEAVTVLVTESQWH